MSGPIFFTTMYAYSRVKHTTYHLNHFRLRYIQNGRYKIGKFHIFTYMFLINVCFVSKCTLVVSNNTVLVYLYEFRTNMTEIDRNIQDGGQNHENILILSCTYNIRYSSSISNIRARMPIIYTIKELFR